MTGTSSSKKLIIVSALTAVLTIVSVFACIDLQNSETFIYGTPLYLVTEKSRLDAIEPEIEKVINEMEFQRISKSDVPFLVHLPSEVSSFQSKTGMSFLFLVKSENAISVIFRAKLDRAKSIRQLAERDYVAKRLQLQFMDLNAQAEFDKIAKMDQFTSSLKTVNDK